MRKVFWLLLVGISFQAWAQNPVAEKYGKLLTPQNAEKHLAILASDEFEGRETGTRGAEMAANYIAGEFKKLNLQAPVNDSYFQNVGLIETDFKVEQFQLNGKPFENFKQFYIAKSASNRKIKAKEIVFAGYGISTNTYDDLKGIDITGKVVLVISKGEPFKNGISLISKTSNPSEWSQQSDKRFENLRAKSPALILAIDPDFTQEILVSRGHRHTTVMSLKKENSVSAEADIIELTVETANNFFKAFGPQTFQDLRAVINKTGMPASRTFKAGLEISYANKVKDVKGVNVMGFLEGSDLKSELLVISAHYDHVGLNPDGPDKVFNGADDDGSGTTAVLELARVLAQAKREGNGPRRSVLFLAVVGEEKGLLGSEWYSRHPVFPLKNTVANLNIDMIGRVDPAHKDNPEYCYLIGSDKLSTQLHTISENANATYTKLNIDYKFNNPNDPERIYYRSDHYNFAKHGIPVIFYFNGVHEDYHKESDEISKINFPLLVKRAQLVFYTAWDIVNRDNRPLVDVTNDMPQSR